jgi:hypothetical protein
VNAIVIRLGGGIVVVLDVAVLVDDVAAPVVVEAIVEGTEVVDAVVTSAVTDRSGTGSR